MKTIFDATMRLSEHFTLGEMCYSATAEAKQIPNIPLKQHITAMQNLCERCLEPVRQQLGLPIKVNSGYRCQLLNQMVGGVSTSQHLRVRQPILPSPAGTVRSGILRMSRRHGLY